MTADPLRALVEKWREEASAEWAQHQNRDLSDWVRDRCHGQHHRLMSCADELSAALSQAGVVGLDLRDIKHRQQWFATQIGEAEGRWVSQFNGRYEAGDDVPDKDHFVTLWLAERAHILAATPINPPEIDSKLIVPDGWVRELRELSAYVSGKCTNSEAATKCLGFIVRHADAMLAAAPAAQGATAPQAQAAGLATFLAPARIHPDTLRLVENFASALAAKLAQAERKYGYTDGWKENDWLDECRAKLLEHVAKGDPRDVAAYCAFLWHHGERTALPEEKSAMDTAAMLRCIADAVGSGTDPVKLRAAIDRALAAAPAVVVDEAMVGRLRTSLWSTWGANRQTTDWPSNDQLRAALAAALGQEVATRSDGAVQCASCGGWNKPDQPGHIECCDTPAYCSSVRRTKAGAWVAEPLGLYDELRSVLNRHSAENASNTPDYVLASFLLGSLDAFNNATNRRQSHYNGATEAPDHG